MSPKREDRKENLSVSLATAGALGTLVLNQFPSPFNYVLIAGYNYLLCYHGQKMAMKARHLYMGSLVNKIGRNKDIYQQNALIGATIAGGLAILPFGTGTLFSTIASGCIGYLVPEIICWT
jgi:hypothetical protein